MQKQSSWLIRRGRLCSSCVRSSMLHGSETWPARKENEVALQRAEMRMFGWMCNVKVKDRVPSKELRERLGIDDIILILQPNRLRWYGHVLQKEDWLGEQMYGMWGGGLQTKRQTKEDTERGCAKRLPSTFYSARNARIASAVLATAIPSVCLSVCLSVRHTPVLCQNDGT